jgi:hypothetical protein
LILFSLLDFYHGIMVIAVMRPDQFIKINGSRVVFAFL